MQRLEEQLLPFGVAWNPEQTKLVNPLQGEAWGGLGCDRRRVRQRQGEGYYLLRPPQKKARQAIKATIRAIMRNGGAAPAKTRGSRMNAALAGATTFGSARAGAPSVQCGLTQRGSSGPY